MPSLADKLEAAGRARQEAKRNLSPSLHQRIQREVFELLEEVERLVLNRPELRPQLENIYRTPGDLLQQIANWLRRVL